MGPRLEAPPGTPSEALLEAISLAQHKLQHLEVMVRMMIEGSGRHGMIQQHQSLSLEFASIMSQLLAATTVFSCPPFFQTSPPHANEAFEFSFDGFDEDELKNTFGEGTFFPSAHSMDGMNPETCQGTCAHLPTGTINASSSIFTAINAQANVGESDVAKVSTNEIGKAYFVRESDNYTLVSSEDHREDDDDGEGESLPPGSYELLELAATEILAEHTHFCEICSKGFKRDANLRMHMRGHGDEYKTAAALARPDKMPRDASAVKLRRYCCPYAGCKRNKKHQKFQPLKSMLCVKNHYRRSHCPKLLICSRWNVKKFSVVADLKTHEKHCGQDKWQCSCGTTFSRKDKLYGHIGLFAGHTPATPAHEIESLKGFGEGLEGLASSNASASGMAGLSANALQDNLAASYVDVNQGLSAFDMPVTGMKTNEKAGGSFNENSSDQRETSAFLSFSKSGLLSDMPIPSSTSTRMGSDGSELCNLEFSGSVHEDEGLKGKECFPEF
ncbi:hypothetical protein GOP47_0017239 [Adiantum capillus-veneris]|uniref:C2H2-type domain-containing protein n=1 Tax=Adiantum capillus-veneris TaxID=13818 RepID=A0A9D4ZC47_ADICA|nr:hypothetical protein GOP47_0016887 [Adiantum capillus-veneris]KAI5068894.1 hypothetical protein GOP47_0017239 [Adiantum capillus-veneris]